MNAQQKTQKISPAGLRDIKKKGIPFTVPVALCGVMENVNAAFLIGRSLIMDINRELCRKLGIEWHGRGPFPHRMCFCGVLDCDKDNPDFIAHPWLLIREMEKRGKLEEFMRYILDHKFFNTAPPVYAGLRLSRLISLDQTGKLARLAVEFLGEKGGGDGQGNS